MSRYGHATPAGLRLQSWRVDALSCKQQEARRETRLVAIIESRNSAGSRPQRDRSEPALQVSLDFPAQNHVIENPEPCDRPDPAGVAARRRSPSASPSPPGRRPRGRRRVGPAAPPRRPGAGTGVSRGGRRSPRTSAGRAWRNPPRVERRCGLRGSVMIAPLLDGCCAVGLAPAGGRSSPAEKLAAAGSAKNRPRKHSSVISLPSAFSTAVWLMRVPS